MINNDVTTSSNNKAKFYLMVNAQETGFLVWKFAPTKIEEQKLMFGKAHSRLTFLPKTADGKHKSNKFQIICNKWINAPLMTTTIQMINVGIMYLLNRTHFIFEGEKANHMRT